MFSLKFIRYLSETNIRLFRAQVGVFLAADALIIGAQQVGRYIQDIRSHWDSVAALEDSRFKHVRDKSLGYAWSQSDQRFVEDPNFEARVLHKS